MMPTSIKLVVLLAALTSLTAILAPVASAAKINAGVSQTTLHGNQSTTHEFVFTDNSNLKGSCKVATFVGSLPGSGTATPVMHPEYEFCTFFGLNATVNTNGCDYELHINAPVGGSYPMATDIECGTGAVTITTLTCEVTIRTQQGLTSAIGTNGASDINLSTNVTGIDYTVDKDGIGCPLKGVGNYTDADYTGTTTLTAATGTVQLEP